MSGFLCVSNRLSSVGLDIAPNTLSHILPTKIGGGGRDVKGRKKEVGVEGAGDFLPKKEMTQRQRQSRKNTGASLGVILDKRLDGHLNLAAVFCK